MDKEKIMQASGEIIDFLVKERGFTSLECGITLVSLLDSLKETLRKSGDNETADQIEVIEKISAMV